MKRLLKHIYSIITLGFLLLLAFACLPDDAIGDPPSCEEIEEEYLELGYWHCEPLDEPVIKQNRFILTVRDKQTGDPLKGIYVSVVWKFFEMDWTEDCETCFGKMVLFPFIGETYGDVTDENGQIEGLSDLAHYKEIREVQNITFRIEDLNGKYAPKVAYLRFPYDVSHGEITAYMLNKELL